MFDKLKNLLKPKKVEPPKEKKSATSANRPARMHALTTSIIVPNLKGI